MLHPNTTYALWRRTIDEKQINSVAVQQGMQFSLGKEVTIQILWPGSTLHKGGDELRDNALVLRIVTPSMRLLLLGVAAESRYAVQGLLTSVDERYTNTTGENAGSSIDRNPGRKFTPDDT
jgi:competence protein ComEC